MRLDDLARREKEKEEDSRKTLLLIIQQQQLHADAQRAKEIQDQDTKRAQEFQQLISQRTIRCISSWSQFDQAPPETNPSF